MYNSVAYSIFTVLCNYYFNSKTFHHPIKNPISIKQSFPIPFSSYLQATTTVLSILLSILDISCKWNHTICDPLVLSSFIQHNVLRSFHAAACISTSFLFMVSTPLYVYVIICLSIHPLWTQACFHLLTFVNNTVNMHVHIFVWVPLFNSFGYTTKSGIARKNDYLSKLVIFNCNL